MGNKYSSCWPSCDEDDDVSSCCRSIDDGFYANYPKLKRADSIGHLKVPEHHFNRNIFDEYDELQVIGIGSMGSVSKVRKRAPARARWSPYLRKGRNRPTKELKFRRTCRSANDLTRMPLSEDDLTALDERKGDYASFGRRSCTSMRDYQLRTTKPPATRLVAL